MIVVKRYKIGCCLCVISSVCHGDAGSGRLKHVSVVPRIAEGDGILPGDPEIVRKQHEGLSLAPSGVQELQEEGHGAEHCEPPHQLLCLRSLHEGVKDFRLCREHDFHKLLVIGDFMKICRLCRYFVVAFLYSGIGGACIPRGLYEVPPEREGVDA